MLELTENEEIIYSRQIRLDWLGKEGQLLLKNKKVLVVGAGGLGCPVLQYLSAAGIGHLTIIDADIVQVHNLHRQVLFSMNDIGSKKAFAAKNKLQSSFPNIQIDAIESNFSLENALELVQNHDLILDCTDNYSTRYLINDACYFAQKPFIMASIGTENGQIALLNSHKRAANYRDIFQSPPDSILDCNALGVLGTLTGIVGLFQAQLAIHFFLNLKPILADKLILIDLFQLKTKTISIIVNPENPLSGDNPSIFELKNEEIYCQIVPLKIQFKDLQLPVSENYTIIDLRESWDFEQNKIPKSYNIPFAEILECDFMEFDTSNFLLVCDAGNKSLTSAKYLQSKFPSKQFYSLEGGIDYFEIEMI